MELQNTYDRKRLFYDIETSYTKGLFWRPGYNQTIHKTNWQDEIYENTMAMDHNITATGAWQNMPYRFSVGYTDQPGIVKTSKFQRTTIAASLNPTLLNDNLNVNFNVNIN